MQTLRTMWSLIRSNPKLAAVAVTGDILIGATVALVILWSAGYFA